MPRGEPLRRPHIREDTWLEDPNELGAVFAAQAAEFAEAVRMKSHSSHPQALPFLRALFPGNDEAVTGGETPASVSSWTG
jgi:hypothetical protein